VPGQAQVVGEVVVLAMELECGVEVEVALVLALVQMDSSSRKGQAPKGLPTATTK